MGAAALTAQLTAWAQAGRIEWLAGEFQESWLDDVWLAIAAALLLRVSLGVMFIAHGLLLRDTGSRNGTFLNGERSDAVAALLRERGIPFIYATGYGAAADDGATLTKPYRREQMEVALERALDGSSP